MSCQSILIIGVLMRKTVVDMWCELSAYSDYRYVNEENGGRNVV